MDREYYPGMVELYDIERDIQDSREEENEDL